MVFVPGNARRLIRVISVVFTCAFVKLPHFVQGLVNIGSSAKLTFGFLAKDLIFGYI
jgi:hypothetical protein